MISRRVLLPALIVASTAASVARAQPVTLRIGTTPEGGGFTPYTVALRETLQSVDRSLVLKSVETGGSTDNARKLQTGEIDLGLVSGEVFHESTAQTSRAARLRVVSVIYSTPGMFAVRADSAYRRIADLVGRPVVWSPRGTGSAVQARYVMDGLGLDPDRDFTALYPEQFTDGPALVLEGRAAAVWGSGLRLPSFVQIADHPIGARFVVPSANEIVRIRNKYPFLVPLTVPAGTYPAQAPAVSTIGSWSFILARADLDEAIGHRLAAALYEAERLRAKSRYMTQTTVRNTLVAVASLDELHAGVLRFYRETKLVE